jgi:hypothetical protein
MTTLRIATVLVILMALGSCGIRESKKNPCALDAEVSPIKLMSGELSYSQFEKYVKYFSDPSFRWIESATYPDRGGFSVDRFELRGKFLGQMGKMEYVFYFRRLAEMRFHPDNTSDFFRAAKSEGLPASNGEKRVVGNLKYWAIRRPTAGEFLGVADDRITRSSIACTAAFD